MDRNHDVSRRRFLGGLLTGASVLSLQVIPFRSLLAENAVPAARRLTYNSIQTSRPVLALTFDDGPHATHTPRLLDTLRARKVRATFYVIGNNVNANPAIAQRIVQEGHEIANHTMTHPSLSRLSAARVSQELRGAHQAIANATGVQALNMRPPYGAVNDQVRRVANNEFGYTTIMWSVDPLDWKYRNSERVTRELTNGAAPGAILLCHDIHATTVAAIPATLDQLLRQGYQFVTVRELLRMESAPVG